jgi:membrane fusion protein (multidrug efflux system)
MGRTFRAPEDVVSKAAYITDITEEIQDVLTVEDLAVDEAPILLFKPTASAKPATARGRRLRLRTVLQAAGAIALLAVAGYYGNYYWTTGRFLVSTDDAYVQAHSVMISPKVSGYISEVPVDDNQPVKAGAVLARIDPRDYQTALDQARANVAVAQASINTLNQQIAQQKLVVEQDRQQVVSDQAALVFSQQDFQRYTHLATTGYGTVQRAQQAQADITEKQAGLQHAATVVAAAERQIGVFEGQLAQATATLAQQRAMEHQAELNLSYTTITAPLDGTVGVRTLRAGQYVQAGTQLMAIAPLQAVYVVANYKETQLTDVQPGQAVTIDIDTFPGAVVHGHVDSVAPASGQEFALLPPDNATGNFTKIVQRIPVKIEIDRNEPLLGRLRPGMSVEPTIDTRPVSLASSSGSKAS